MHKKDSMNVGGIKMDYDSHLDHEVEKHTQEQENNEPCSECCGADVEEFKEKISCTDCGAYCNITSRSEYLTYEYESEMDDRADAERDERKNNE